METFETWSERARDLDLGGLRMAVHDDGPNDAPVVTFLHGYPSSSLDVVPVLDRIGDEVRLLAPDLPGFGASEKPADHPYSIHGAADAVEALWAAVDVGQSILLAHDYSVSVAQELLARQLDGTGSADITGVVWCNGGIWPDLHRQSLGQQLLLDPEHGAAVAAAMDEAALTTGLHGTWGVRRAMSEAESHGIWRSMEHDGGSQIAHRLLHYVADRLEHADRWRPALENAAVPMRFVWGELDPISGGHVAERIEEQLALWPAGRTLERLPDVGHWPPLEAPDEVADAVRSLL